MTSWHVDTHLLPQLQPLIRAFVRYPRKVWLVDAPKAPTAGSE